MSLLIGCTTVERPEPTVEDLAGRWVNGETVLILNADSSFSLTGAPAYTAVGETSAWKNNDLPSREKSGEWTIALNFVSLRGEVLSINYVGSEIVLLWGLDLGSDSPRCYELVREESSLVPRGPETCFLRA
jgi:hypothetical protein